LAEAERLRQSLLADARQEDMLETIIDRVERLENMTFTEFRSYPAVR
jgi:hypothetical protein